uniref:Uncharacterized protein n=1 Tax=Anopheles coluzzii TaxID=1518534 RepID=A0A8W7PHD3_ANOCL
MDYKGKACHGCDRAVGKKKLECTRQIGHPFRRVSGYSVVLRQVLIQLTQNVCLHLGSMPNRRSAGGFFSSTTSKQMLHVFLRENTLSISCTCALMQLALCRRF